MLHPIALFVAEPVEEMLPTYWYEGRCRQTGQQLKLPRTALSEAIARSLMNQLTQSERFLQEGKMYGVLIVETPARDRFVLKAFSGLLNGSSTVAGWVPPIPGRADVALQESQTLAQLETFKQELIALQHISERRQFDRLTQQFADQLAELNSLHRQQKADRQQQRQQILATRPETEWVTALEQLDEQSRQAGLAKRRLKQARDAALNPLKAAIEQADLTIQTLKQRRKTLSQQLQAAMHRAYVLTNFAGQSLAIEQFGALPTGTGDCCAPKLLHYAATHSLKPLAMAEFWWGAAEQDKLPRAFYGACADRCQPLMSFLLSGLSLADQISRSLDVPILYADDWLIAVNKPAGLLSVPGRSHDRQDSVLARLKVSLSSGELLKTVHRLDQDTSGVLLLARNPEAHRHLSQQFQQRQVRKVYEALLCGCLSTESGLIDLPLWADPTDRPRQKVDYQWGKPSQTQFRVLAATQTPRVELMPLTGRTHQLRVHAADPNGLNAPILGDRLYGNINCDRLYLHAKHLEVQHPYTGNPLQLTAEVPF